MVRIIWTEPAIYELDEIADYISLDNPTAAKHLVKLVYESISRLEDHPFSGKTVEEIGSTVYRELVIPPCRVFYRTEKGFIIIIHVIRGERRLFLDLLVER